MKSLTSGTDSWILKIVCDLTLVSASDVLSVESGYMIVHDCSSHCTYLYALLIDPMVHLLGHFKTLVRLHDTCHTRL